MHGTVSRAGSWGTWVVSGVKGGASRRDGESGQRCGRWREMLPLGSHFVKLKSVPFFVFA